MFSEATLDQGAAAATSVHETMRLTPEKDPDNEESSYRHLQERFVTAAKLPHAPGPTGYKPKEVSFVLR